MPHTPRANLVRDSHGSRDLVQRMACGQTAALGKGESRIGSPSNESKQLNHLIESNHIVSQGECPIPFDLCRHSAVHPQTFGDEILIELQDSLGTLLVDGSHSLQYRQGDYCTCLSGLHWA